MSTTLHGINVNRATREEWLIAATHRLRDGMFLEQGITVPPTVRVSVSFPGGGSARKRIGEAWHPKSSADNIPQVFISPTLADPILVLDVLVHELIHTAYPDAGHKKPFKDAMKKLGLTGKPTATVAGPELRGKLECLNTELGPYPHAAIKLSDRKKQTTRLIKCECPYCGYVVRTTHKWIEEMGAPLCPCAPSNPERMKVK